MKRKTAITILVLVLLIGSVYAATASNLWDKIGVNNTKNSGQVISPEPQEKEMEINLYYANKKYVETGDENLEQVLPLKKKVKYGTVSLAEAAVKELFNDPETGGLSTEIKDVKLIGVEVKGEIAYVNFSSQGLNGSSLQEMMLINQIVSTLTGLEGINKVQFLVDGKQADTLMGHADVREPIY